MTTNAYADTIALGYEAYDQGDSRRHNPYIFHTTPWYAWDSGWSEAQREATKPSPDTDLELEAALAAYGEAISK